MKSVFHGAGAMRCNKANSRVAFARSDPTAYGTIGA